MDSAIHYIIFRFVQIYNIIGFFYIYNTMYSKHKLVYLQRKGIYVII